MKELSTQNFDFIRKIEHGIPLQTLEQRLHPGNSSSVGFLGETEHLLDVVRSDWKTLQKFGVTHKQVAAALRKNIPQEGLIDTNLVVVHEDFEFSPTNVRFLGLQSCPWECPHEGMTLGTIIKKDANYDQFARAKLWESNMSMSRQLELLREIDIDIPDSILEMLSNKPVNEKPFHVPITGLLPHLIEEHYFFEGRESPYRADPELLIKALNLAT